MLRGQSSWHTITKMKQKKMTKKIEWEEIAGHPITKWYGRINGFLFFEICQFKNKVFTDPYIMTSRIIPFGMKKDTNLEELQETAQIILEAFHRSLDHDSTTVD